MVFRKVIIVCIFWAALLATAGCSGSFDEETGDYSYKDFSLQFPRGWGKTKTTPGALITVGNREELYQIDVIAQDVPEGGSFDQYVKSLMSNYKRVGKYNGSGQMIIGGIDGHWSDWTMTIGGYKYRSLVYAVMRDGKMFTVICIAAEDKFPTYEESFDGVAESITFG